MNNIRMSAAAQRDLAEIKQYIELNLENPTAALSTAKMIVQKIRILADHAWAGAALNSIADVDSDYRFLVTGNYLVFYRVYGNDVFVDRILYGRRNYLNILLGDLTED